VGIWAGVGTRSRWPQRAQGTFWPAALSAIRWIVLHRGQPKSIMATPQ
jgi:hypothetical protein